MISPDDDAPLLELDSPLATLERVGGKGASLARLAAAGLPVPPGFHITTAAYRRFVTENHLTEPILAAVAGARVEDPGSLERASEQIQSLFAAGTMPADLAALCRQWHGRLGADDPAVAVRSSATAEDLPEMSFAGQQETYLNVRGDHVLEAVVRCWASLWTARALGYRARLGIRPAEVAIAVVVQELVPADVAGVLFTANPLTGARDQVVINAAWGLGEAIVGGKVTPDTYVVNRQTDAIESREIADKEVMTVRLSAGTQEEAVPDERRKQPALEPAQVDRAGAPRRSDRATFQHPSRHRMGRCRQVASSSCRRGPSPHCRNRAQRLTGPFPFRREGTPDRASSNCCPTRSRRCSLHWPCRRGMRPIEAWHGCSASNEHSPSNLS